MVRRARPPACFDAGAAQAITGYVFWRCQDSAPERTDSMADRVVPHFHNTPGVAVIEIGAREFMCEGEVAPFDHPHVYLDMGDATEIICPYCSTLFRHDPTPRPPCGATARVRAGGWDDRLKAGAAR